jgi:hypothetical protein
MRGSTGADGSIRWRAGTRLDGLQRFGFDRRICDPHPALSLLRCACKARKKYFAPAQRQRNRREGIKLCKNGAGKPEAGFALYNRNQSVLCAAPILLRKEKNRP